MEQGRDPQPITAPVMPAEDVSGDTTEILEAFDEAGRPLHTEEIDPERKDGPSYQLIVRTGQQAGRSWYLATGTTKIGRHAYNDVALDHITVSRSHCQVFIDESGPTLTDLGSTNGTYLNGRLVEHAGIASGDELMIGVFRLLVRRTR